MQQETLSISKQRKKDVICAILNLYLFGDLEMPKFEKVGSRLKAKVTSPYAFHFLNDGYSKTNREMVFDFFEQISRRFPKNMKLDIYVMLYTHSLFDFYRNLTLLGKMIESTVDDPIDLFAEDIKLYTEIHYSFVENQGSTEIMNEFLFFLANFHSSLVLEDENYISRKTYYAAIREKLKEVEKYEEPILI